MRFMLAFLTFFSLAAQAAEYQIGQEVLYHDSAITMRGTITDLTKDGEVAIDFGDYITNLNYGHQPSTSYLRPYHHTDELLVRNFFFYPMFTLKLGEPVVYRDSVTWMRGEILDLTLDGYALVDFHSPATRIYNYINAGRHLRPAN